MIFMFSALDFVTHLFKLCFVFKQWDPISLVKSLCIQTFSFYDKVMMFSYVRCLMISIVVINGPRSRIVGSLHLPAWPNSTLHA